MSATDEGLRALESRTVFAGWAARPADAVRDVAGAGRVLEGLLRGGDPAPSVVVTGSKGKGQTAAEIAWRLQACGLRVGLVSSPGIISNRDRFVLDGQVLPAAAYRAGLHRLAAVLPEAAPAPGAYLAPTDLFTVLGHAMLRAAGAQVVVHEAGMGGAHDAVSLFDPVAVALTRILPEHLDVFGPSLMHVAQEKIGLVHGPAPVASVPQAPGPDRLLRRTCARHTAPLVVVPAGDFLVENERVALAAARAAARALGVDEPPEGFGSSPVRRPGRGSAHRLPDGWLLVVDAGIDAAGAAHALEAARAVSDAGRVQRVWWSVPMTKDWRAIADLLDDRGVEHAFVDLGRDGHLDYRLPGELTERVPVIGLAQLLERIRPGRDAASDPTRVELALGTISFGTAVLRQLGVQVRRLWSLETPRG
ncbi:hypothetical protein AB0O80_05385 [Rothia kristinae]|uniref:hypothetical protein n=1 Tax=Rothia kristinae TaxID=37923 RepID=UPI0034269374